MMGSYIQRALLSLCLVFFVCEVSQARSECDKLWGQYEEAKSKDLPRTQMSVLSEIKSLASIKRLDEDFFEASRLYFETGCNVNWKLRDSLSRVWEKEIRDYNEAEITCCWMKEIGAQETERYEFIQLNRARLEKSSHKDLWGKYSKSIYSEFSENDYEFELWSLYDSAAKDDSLYLKELKDYEADSYPLAAYLEFLQCDPDQYSAFIEKYEGRAICLYAKKELLDMVFEKLLLENSVTEDDYKALYKKCKEYKRLCSKYRGEERRVVSTIESVESIIDVLTGQSIRLTADSSLVSIYLTNVPKVVLSLLSSDGKSTIFEKKLDNSKRSFFVVDTLRARLPDLEDGEYLLTAKYRDIKDIQTYSSYRLSVALRPSSEGFRFYIAEFDTGKPIENADVILKNADGVVAQRNGVSLDGFTALPEEMLNVLSNPQKCDLLFRTVDELSHDMIGRMPYYGFYWKGRGGFSSVQKPRVNAEIFTDRGAYNPGDTLHFKAVFFYEGEDLVTLSKGLKCRVSLVGPDGKELYFNELYTNEYGSVAGDFPLGRELKNGRFFIRIVYGDNSYTKWLRVDDFSLPSYELTFDPINRLYRPGDNVRITGVLKAYDEHPLELAKASYQVNDGAESKELEVSEDGSFVIAFPTDKTSPYQYYTVNVRVVQKGGEVREFRKFINVSEHVSVIASLKNSEQGVFSIDGYDQNYILLGEKAVFDINVNTCDGIDASLPIDYKISDEDGVEVKSGRTISGKDLEVDMNGVPSGAYRVSVWAYSDTTSFNILKFNKEDRHFNSKSMWAVVKSPDNSGFYIGSGDGKDLYAVVEVYDKKTNALIDNMKLYTMGGSLVHYAIDYDNDVLVNVFAFKGGRKLDYTMTFSHPERSLDLPLEFSFFEDKTLPNTEYTFTIKTLPGVECLAGVYDKSVDNIVKNEWQPIRKNYGPSLFTLSYEGRVGTASPLIKYMMRSTGASADSATLEENASEGDALPIREKFEKTLTFQPFLHTDEKGVANFSFKTSGKLSTYYVSLFAHDPKVRNSVLRKEMVVTIPVRIALSGPKYLYVGDKCEIPISISSIYDRNIEGKLSCYVNGHLVKEQMSLVPAFGSSNSTLLVEAKSTGAIDVKVEFSSTNSFSDAIRVTIPVYPATQIITESYSMVLSRPEQQESAKQILLERFVNATGDSVNFSQRRVYDMLDELCSSNVAPRGGDVISLCDALYVRELLNKMKSCGYETDSLKRQIISCQNADGGFAWYSGMRSSPAITAVLLEHFAKLSKCGIEALGEDLCESAVKYLDESQFGSISTLLSGISCEQYVYIRSMYPKVPFEVKEKQMEDFKKWAKNYLTNSERQHNLLYKVRRLYSLRNLAESEEGEALARKWGIGPIRTNATLWLSLETQVASLLEYAVETRYGGMYYPNVVMPYRGLLEDEAYAHSMIADLLRGYDPITKPIADGICIWLLVQKETQHWDTTPAFIDVVNSVLNASESVKKLSVISASKSFSAPLDEIKKSGNGFTLQVVYSREDNNGKYLPLSEGDTLHLGDKIKAEYRIWSEDNRSFVKVVMPRCAAFRPVDELSSSVNYGSAYREVKSSCTQYMFDVFPEEKSVVTEYMNITSKGVFRSPVPEVECVYASHYRANDVSQVFKSQ